MPKGPQLLKEKRPNSTIPRLLKLYDDGNSDPPIEGPRLHFKKVCSGWVYSPWEELYVHVSIPPISIYYSFEPLFDGTVSPNPYLLGWSIYDYRGSTIFSRRLSKRSQPRREHVVNNRQSRSWDMGIIYISLAALACLIMKLPLSSFPCCSFLSSSTFYLHSTKATYIASFDPSNAAIWEQ